jgi:hypothetical protein
MINICSDPVKAGATSATRATALFGAVCSVAPSLNQGATSATNRSAEIILWHLWHHRNYAVLHASPHGYWLRHLWHLWHQKKRGRKSKAGGGHE